MDYWQEDPWSSTKGDEIAVPKPSAYFGQSDIVWGEEKDKGKQRDGDDWRSPWFDAGNVWDASKSREESPWGSRDHSRERSRESRETALKDQVDGSPVRKKDEPGKASFTSSISSPRPSDDGGSAASLSPVEVHHGEEPATSGLDEDSIKSEAVKEGASATEPRIDEDPTLQQPEERAERAQVADFVELSLIHHLFPTSPSVSSSDIEGTDDLLFDPSASELWKRLSRRETAEYFRSTKAEDAYTRVTWDNSQVKRETIDIVSRWRNKTQSGSDPSSMFSWNSAGTKQLSPVSGGSLGRLSTAQARKSSSGPLGAKKTPDSALSFQFAWSSTSVEPAKPELTNLQRGEKSTSADSTKPIMEEPSENISTDLGPLEEKLQRNTIEILENQVPDEDDLDWGDWGDIIAPDVKIVDDTIHEPELRQVPQLERLSKSLAERQETILEQQSVPQLKSGTEAETLVQRDIASDCVEPAISSSPMQSPLEQKMNIIDKSHLAAPGQIKKRNALHLPEIFLRELPENSKIRSYATRKASGVAQKGVEAMRVSTMETECEPAASAAAVQTGSTAEEELSHQQTLGSGPTTDDITDESTPRNSIVVADSEVKYPDSAFSEPTNTPPAKFPNDEDDFSAFFSSTPQLPAKSPSDRTPSADPRTELGEEFSSFFSSPLPKPTNPPEPQSPPADTSTDFDDAFSAFVSSSPPPPPNEPIIHPASAVNSFGDFVQEVPPKASFITSEDMSGTRLCRVIDTEPSQSTPTPTAILSAEEGQAVQDVISNLSSFSFMLK